MQSLHALRWLAAGTWCVATAVAPAVAGTITVEIESLQATVSAGSVTKQEMAGFGGAWGAGSQLLWSPPPPVDQPIRNWPHLTVNFDVPAAQRYEVTLAYTVAPDYGRVRVFLDGSPRLDFDGHAAAVDLRRVSLGSQNLAAGRHQLVFTVFAKAAAASGFLVGLDRLELRSSGEEGASSSAARAGAMRPRDVASLSDLARRALSEAGGGGQATSLPLTLSAQRLAEPGRAHLDLVRCDRLDSDPPRILLHGLDDDAPGGEAHVSLSTTPGLVYLVSFQVGPGATRTRALGRFAAQLLEGPAAAAEATRTVESPEDGLRVREVAIAFKARSNHAQVVLRRAEPGSDYELRRVEITTAR